MHYHYTAYDLSITSALECPELIATDPAERADVTIALAELSERIEAPLHAIGHAQFGEGVFQIEIPGVARYRVVAGHSILVHPFPGTSSEDVRLFLLGTALGALLHQQGRLPLHASAVEWAGGAIAFCGASGAGKSTLAAAFHQRGHRLLCDDVGVVVPDAAGAPRFYPGFPRVKLWRDALEHLDFDARALHRERSGTEKYHLQLHDAFHRRPLPLRRIYFLRWGDPGGRAAIHPLEARQGVPLLIANTYRAALTRRVGDLRAHFLRCARVAESVPLRRYVRPCSLERLGASLDSLVEDLFPEQPSG